jgi:hypothetical protein
MTADRSSPSLAAACLAACQMASGTLNDLMGVFIVTKCRDSQTIFTLFGAYACIDTGS